MDIWGEIGSAAGVVYTALSGEKKSQNLLDVKRKTKLSDEMFSMGLGWLAREGKVKIDRDKTKTTLSVIG